VSAIVVTVDESAWRTAVDVAVAVGTVGAAAAAWWAARRANRIAKDDRRHADSRAEIDRKEADRRAREDQLARDKRDERERRTANLRYRLERLTAIAEAFEDLEVQDPHAYGAVARAKATLRARLGASPDPLPLVRAVVGEGEFTPAIVNDVYQPHRDLLAPDHRDKSVVELFALGASPIARAAIYGAIREVRWELLGEQNPERAMRNSPRLSD
jgi:hypothetical protein